MNERGSLLITGLWMLAFFSILSVSLTFDASQHLLMMKREMEGLQTKGDFVSGLNQVAAKIHQDPLPYEDSQDDAWYGRVVTEGALGERLSIDVGDEEAKINLNTATEQQLVAFFKLYEEEIMPLKGDHKTYIKAITELRARQRILSLEELLLKDDFEKEDYEGLASYLTVYPDRNEININTASSIVLRSVILAVLGDEASKQILIGKLTQVCGAETAASGSRCSFLSRELLPASFTEKLGLPKTPLMTSIIQDFLSRITTDSENYHVRFQSKAGHWAETVFRYREGDFEPKIFFWHED